MTLTISFIDAQEPLVFSGVTRYKHDTVSGNVSVVHDGGEFNEQLQNISIVDIY